MTLDHSKMGTFVVTFDFIESVDKASWSALMGDVVIVDTEIDHAAKHIIYAVISDRFSELTPTARVPRYTPTWNHEEGRFTWRAVR